MFCRYKRSLKSKVSKFSSSRRRIFGCKAPVYNRLSARIKNASIQKYHAASFLSMMRLTVKTRLLIFIGFSVILVGAFFRSSAVDLGKPQNAPVSVHDPAKTHRNGSKADDQHEDLKQNFDILYNKPDRKLFTKEKRIKNEIRHPIPTNYVKNAENIYVMLKTGVETMWKRMPIHFFTTLTRIPHFSLYADGPGTIFGYEIIDILAGMPEDVMDADSLRRYKGILQMHEENYNWAPHFLKSKEGWDMDKFKNIRMLVHAYKQHPESEWFLFMDDDSYIFMDSLVEFLGQWDPMEPLYFGKRAPTMANGEFISFAHGGSVVVVSKGAADALVGPNAPLSNQELLDKYARHSLEDCCGDAVFAQALFIEAGIRLYDIGQYVGEEGEKSRVGSVFQSENLESLVFRNGYLCNPLLTLHHLDSAQIEALWEWESLHPNKERITYTDVYQDFVLPYIVPWRPNWAISFDAAIAYQPGHDPVTVEDKELQVTSIREDCGRLCTSIPNCAVYSWKMGECRIGVDGLVFGKASNKYSSNHETGWSTSFDIDRIREWRARGTCDSLSRTSKIKFNPTSKHAEGWYIRDLVEKYHNDPANFTLDSSTLPLE